MPARGKGNAYQGSKWIRREKRLAIYLRDGLSCVWCGHSLEDGAQLSLDHIVPHNQGGKNETGNLITSCKRCNSSRADRSVEQFASAVANYLNHGITPEQVINHVNDCLMRAINVESAKNLISLRGGFTQALYKDYDEFDN